MSTDYLMYIIYYMSIDNLYCSAFDNFVFAVKRICRENSRTILFLSVVYHLYIISVDRISYN
jgi:hypothetical protein